MQLSCWLVHRVCVRCAGGEMGRLLLTCTARCDRAERLGPDRPVEEVVLACWAAAPSPLRKPERLPQPHPLDVG